MASFLEKYAGTPLGAIFADNTMVSIHDPGLEWLRLPPRGFEEYVASPGHEVCPSLPADPATYRPGATFLIAQAHRIWLTLGAIERSLPPTDDAVLLNLGGFPFAIDVAIRKYLKRDLKIIATHVQELSSEVRRRLRGHRIELLPVNLDPYVPMPFPQPGMCDALPFEDASIDVVVLTHVIEHLYHPMAILREAVRVLKPEGRLIISTDHGFRLGGLLNYLEGGEFLLEPVELSAAMVFDEWRGHVRFYTEGDLRTLISSLECKIADCGLYEVLYNSVLPEYFVDPNTQIPRWRATLLQEFPALRNEIILVAEKP